MALLNPEEINQKNKQQKQQCDSVYSYFIFNFYQPDAKRLFRPIVYLIFKLAFCQLQYCFLYIVLSHHHNKTASF